MGIVEQVACQHGAVATSPSATTFGGDQHLPLDKAGAGIFMLTAVEEAMQKELRWPLSMVRHLEDSKSGSGLQWAAERVRRWIEETQPDGHEELLRLIGDAESIGLSASDSKSLLEESRRVWYLYLGNTYPQRAVSRLYEALAALASGNRDGYIQSLASGVFVAASRENFTTELFDDLQRSYEALLASAEK